MDNPERGPWDASTPAVHDAIREALDGAARRDARDERAEDAGDASGAAAVATVTGVEGSAYRRPGAKMVLGDSADAAPANASADSTDASDTDAPASAAVGAITAGCLEGPVADLADRAVSDGPLRKTFDLTNEDEWSFGLGCNGVIDVLVEPADESFAPALDALADGKRVALLTVAGGDRADAPVGARALWDDGGASPTNPRPPIPDDVLTALGDRPREFAETGRSDTVEVTTERGTAAVFVDGLEPAPDLLVFGGQRDARPVTRFARQVGFRVTVAVARGGHADADRFPAADRVVTTKPTDLGDLVAHPATTYAVVMSHNFVDDRLALVSVLETDVPYVGLMGPRERFEEMREAMADEGVELAEADRERISTPVGLDLGGGEPSQVALSVVAEALAVANGRVGGRLSDRETPIHPRDEFDSAPDSASDS